VWFDALINYLTATGYPWNAEEGRIGSCWPPDLQVIEVPASFATGPEYGLAILDAGKPAAVRLAFAILSPEGQAAIGGYEVADCIVGATVQILGRPRVDPPGR